MRSRIRLIRGITVWIRSRGMECMSGKMGGLIRAILIMISGLALANCIREINLSIEGTGKMGNRLMTKYITKIELIYLHPKLSLRPHHKFIIVNREAPKN